MSSYQKPHPRPPTDWKHKRLYIAPRVGVTIQNPAVNSGENVTADSTASFDGALLFDVRLFDIAIKKIELQFAVLTEFELTQDAVNASFDNIIFGSCPSSNMIFCAPFLHEFE